LLLMLGSILIIVTPLYFLIDMLSTRVSEAITSKDKIQGKIELGLKEIENEFGINILQEINMGDVTSVVVKIIQQILNTSINDLIQLGFAYLMHYFMLMNNRKMEHCLYQYIPIKS